ncbi:hypothetical protein RSAG8_11753, partial [Rhizoctonia solani AG-8 WAC10335]
MTREKLNSVRELYDSTIEAFRRPDWEDSDASIVKKLRRILENKVDSTDRKLVNLIKGGIEDVYPFECELHKLCLAHKAGSALHPDPYFAYNGYNDALDWLLAGLLDKFGGEVPGRMNADVVEPTQLHLELVIFLEGFRKMGEAIAEASQEIKTEESVY